MFGYSMKKLFGFKDSVGIRTASLGKVRTGLFTRNSEKISLAGFARHNGSLLHVRVEDSLFSYQIKAAFANLVISANDEATRVTATDIRIR